MSKTNEEHAIEPARSAAVLSPDAGMAAVAERLIDQARNDGIALTGAGGLLTGLVQQVLQASLESELTEHRSVVAQLTRDRRRITTDLPGDRPNTFALSAQESDLLAFTEGQVAA